jgi:hypothetical protein
LSIHTLPAGTDVLMARLAEMKAHAHGKLARQPEPAWATFKALVTRTAVLDASLTPPGPDTLGPIAARLAGEEAGELYLGYEWSWRAMAALILALLSVEARLEVLDEMTHPADPGLLEVLDEMTHPADPGLLEVMAGEIACYGFLPRHEWRFHDAMELLVVRVLSAEARASAKDQPATT